MADENLTVSSSTISALDQFISLPKFVEEDFYPAPSEEVRVQAELLVNDLATRIRAGVSSNPTKVFVLSEFKPTMDAFTLMDSEEQDQLMGYLHKLMDIFGIESSDGLIGQWRYGYWEPANDP